MSEAKVAGHYTRGKLEETILLAVARTGVDPERLKAMDLAVADEFHVGGLEATQELAAQMELRPGLRVLDVGSGIGGPARYFGAEHQCKVTGIDLTEEFVQVARSLTRRAKLDHLVEFVQGSALNMTFPTASFDRSYMIHVGMNIADKAGVFQEVRRVLKPGGLFAIFDILRTREHKMAYPVPWATNEETSFVVDVNSYREALQRAGFRVERERNRKAFAIEFTERAIARAAQSGHPALSLRLLMGELAPVMIKNVLAMMKEGVLEPVELYARAE
ncbi:MAG: ubiquinone biosynthesis protein [Acidobacteria bacterium]|nr:MAG: ubiquinone biosynthesis protein [Acidobacteriota bacterium]